METIEFKKVLFKTAFCVMACDGHIDQLEINEMKKIDTNTSYFNDVDLSNELDDLVKEINVKGKIIFSELFKTLRNQKLTLVQELLIIEVSLRIMNADDKVDESEVKFINHLRSKLEVDNQILIDRFGSVPFLKNINYNKINNDEISSLKKFINDIQLPNAESFNVLNSKK